MTQILQNLFGTKNNQKDDVFDPSYAPEANMAYDIASKLKLTAILNGEHYVINKAQEEIITLFSGTLSGLTSRQKNKIKTAYLTLQKFLKLEGFDIEEHIKLVETIQKDKNLEVVFGSDIYDVDLLPKYVAFNKAITSIATAMTNTPIHKHNAKTQLTQVIAHIETILKLYQKNQFLSSYAMRPYINKDSYGIGVVRKHDKKYCGTISIYKITELLDDVESYMGKLSQQEHQITTPMYIFTPSEQITDTIITNALKRRKNDGFTTVYIKEFSYPRHYYGGADTNNRTYKNSVPLYCTTEEAAILLYYQGSNREHKKDNWGYGREFSKTP